MAMDGEFHQINCHDISLYTHGIVYTQNGMERKYYNFDRNKRDLPVILSVCKFVLAKWVSISSRFLSKPISSYRNSSRSGKALEKQSGTYMIYFL